MQNTKNKTALILRLNKLSFGFTIHPSIVIFPLWLLLAHRLMYFHFWIEFEQHTIDKVVIF